MTVFNYIDGFWMWSIFFLQMTSFVIIVERIFSLYLLRKPNQTIFAAKYVNKVPIDSKNFIGKVVCTLEEASFLMDDKELIQQTIDEKLTKENNKIEKNTGFLAFLANLGTLCGLLGTVVGLIQAFASVSQIDPSQKAQTLTKGISLAMNSTAYGLIMAVPALVMYAVLQNRGNLLIEDANSAALKIYNFFVLKSKNKTGV